MNNLNQLGTERKLRSEKGKHPFKNPRWVYEGEKLRVHIAALGDVGATTLMGLKLLGGDVIETIGIIDLDENRMKRYEAECNQICYPWAYDVLPKVVLLKEDELFDCDVFIFCATKGVPPGRYGSAGCTHAAAESQPQYCGNLCKKSAGLWI